MDMRRRFAELSHFVGVPRGPRRGVGSVVDQQCGQLAASGVGRFAAGGSRRDEGAGQCRVVVLPASADAATLLAGSGGPGGSVAEATRRRPGGDESTSASGAGAGGAGAGAARRASVAGTPGVGEAAGAAKT